jgi:hypothetical protein
LAFVLGAVGAFATRTLRAILALIWAATRSAAKFAHGDFTVRILIELFECGGGFGNFGFVDGAILVRIQGDFERGHGSIAARTALGSGIVLSLEVNRWQREAQRQ